MPAVCVCVHEEAATVRPRSWLAVATGLPQRRRNLALQAHDLRLVHVATPDGHRSRAVVESLTLRDSSLQQDMHTLASVQLDDGAWPFLDVGLRSTTQLCHGEPLERTHARPDQTASGPPRRPLRTPSANAE